MYLCPVSYTHLDVYKRQVALRSLSFTVGGQPASVPPVDGDEVNVNVVFDNSSGALVKRTIILAAYDADGVLQQLTANNADVAVGKSIVSGSEDVYKRQKRLFRQ